MSEASKLKTMTTETLQIENIHHDHQVIMKKRRRRCVIAIGVLLLLLIILITVSAILAFTLFKPKDPKTQLVSATLEGISPRITFPAINIQLNLTLDLKIQVENRNRVNFKHGEGKSILLYNGNQVGETEIYPGLIHAKSTSTLPSRLTLQLDQLAGSNTSDLIGDVLGGELSMDTVTRIPGRVSFLGGIIKKHIVAVSNCQFTIGISDMKIRSQNCKNKAKF